MSKEPALAALGTLMDHIAFTDRSLTVRCKRGQFTFEVDENDEPAI